MATQQNTSDQWELPSQSEPVKNIVLVGRTGNGKSATANSIIGKDTFKSDYQAVGVTLECQTFRVDIPSGPIINVIDTPGLFDLAVSSEFICKEIVSCLALAEEGLHAVVLVISLSGRISKEEEDTLRTLQLLFGSNILDYLIVLFTCGDMLEDRNMTIENYLSKGCPDFLKTALRLCGGRKVVFDNRTTNKEKKANQLQELVAYVEAIGRATHGNPYTDRMHRKIQEEAERVKREEKEIEERDIAEAEKAELKRQLELSHGQNMGMMAQMMERMLNESAAANERQMNMMKHFMEITLQGKDAQRQRDKEKKAMLREQQQEHHKVKPKEDCRIL